MRSGAGWWLLSAVLALSGCGRAPEIPETPGRSSAALLAVRDDPARHLTIRWHGSFYAEGGQPDSWIERRIEELYNVSIDSQFLAAFSYDRLLALRLVGGEIPDVFWVRDARQLKRAAEHGFALEVPYDVVVQHAPDYVRRLMAAAPDGWLLSLYKGINYGLPNFNVRQSLYPHPGIWNLTWLQRVGFAQVPETLEEMERALRLFREADPDRDGQRDTFGYCPWKPGSSGGYSSNGTLDRSFEEVFGAFGIAQNAWLLREGRVTWGGMLPEAREALAVLRRWYGGGLIHPDYMTLPMGNFEVRKQFVSGKVGFITGFNLGNWGEYDARNRASMLVQHTTVHPGEQLAPARFPLGPRGQRGARTWDGSIGGVLAFGPHLGRTPEKLVRVLRWLNDAARDPALYRELRFGRRGLHWEWDDALGIMKIPPFDHKGRGARELLGESAMMQAGDNHGYFLPFSSTAEELDALTPEPARKFRETYMRPEWGIRDVILAEDTVPSAGKFLPSLVELQSIFFTSIITGKLPLEAFDTFVERWRREGGDVLTREANEVYAQKQAIRARVESLLGASIGRVERGTAPTVTREPESRVSVIPP